jgi:hypothetical protein
VAELELMVEAMMACQQDDLFAFLTAVDYPSVMMMKAQESEILTANGSEVSRSQLTLVCLCELSKVV